MVADKGEVGDGRFGDQRIGSKERKREEGAKKESQNKENIEGLQAREIGIKQRVYRRLTERVIRSGQKSNRWTSFQRKRERRGGGSAGENVEQSIKRKREIMRKEGRRAKRGNI